MFWGQETQRIKYRSWSPIIIPLYRSWSPIIIPLYRSWSPIIILLFENCKCQQKIYLINHVSAAETRMTGWMMPYYLYVYIFIFLKSEFADTFQNCYNICHIYFHIHPSLTLLLHLQTYIL
jgi:hypothetical protein